MNHPSLAVIINERRPVPFIPLRKHAHRHLELTTIKDNQTEECIDIRAANGNGSKRVAFLVVPVPGGNRAGVPAIRLDGRIDATGRLTVSAPITGRRSRHR